MRRIFSFKDHSLFLILLAVSMTLTLTLTTLTRAETYSFTQIPYIGETYGDVGAYYQAWVTGINDLGQVVGRDQTASVPRAFIWSESEGMQYFENTIQPGWTMEFLDINNKGEAVGAGYYIPIYWSQETGLIQLAGPSGYPYGFASAINNHGEIVGGADTIDLAISRAVLWDTQGVPQLLNTLSGKTQNGAYDINPKGDVVGISYNTYVADESAFLWQKKDGMGSLLPLLGDSQSRAAGINPKGQVVGSSCDASGYPRAVLWEKGGGVQYLGLLTGYPYSGALAINSSGKVVGFAYNLSGDERPFIWTKQTGMQDLNNLVQGLPAGVTLIEAYDINSQGQIIVYGFNSNTDLSVHGVLTPITD